MAYKLAVQRLDNTHWADGNVFNGPRPDFGAVIEHECGGENIKVRIIGIRAIPGRGIGDEPLDQVEAVEVGRRAMPQPPDLSDDNFRAKVFRDRVNRDDWRVEKEDEDGSTEIAVFSGPLALERAVNYADRQYGGAFDLID